MTAIAGEPGCSGHGSAVPGVGAKSECMGTRNRSPKVLGTGALSNRTTKVASKSSSSQCI